MRHKETLPPGVKLLQTLRGHSGPILNVVWARDRRTLASSTGDGIVRLWNVETGNCIRIFQTQPAKQIFIAFDLSGRTLAIGGDNTVKFWRIESKSPFR